MWPRRLTWRKWENWVVAVLLTMPSTAIGTFAVGVVGLYVGFSGFTREPSRLGLAALVVNAFDAQYGHEFWQTLFFPDIYELRFEHNQLASLQGVWSIE